LNIKISLKHNISYGADGMDIYIKPKKKAEIAGRHNVILGDVADIYAEAGLTARVLNIKLLNSRKQGVYTISVMEMVAAITAALPGHSVVNLGEPDTVIIIKDKPTKNPIAWVWVKVALVCIVLFIGSATAIMTFHTDSQLSTVFQKYYEIFFGQEVENPYIINIPYSIGLALGIVLFFNHFTKSKKSTREPSPIEIEMEKYELDAEDALIQNLNRQKEKDSHSAFGRNDE
jgi:stage V sporulation protein AA